MRTRNFLTLLFVFAANISAYAQNQITIEHQGQTSVYENLASAISGAQAGDTLYLSGGNYSATGVDFSKPLHLFGTGYHPDSTTATGRTIVGEFLLIQTAASGGSIEGIYFTTGIKFGMSEATNDVSDFSLKRCYVKSLDMGNFPSAFASNNIISECVIAGSLSGSYGGLPDAQNNTFKNNVIYNGIEGFGSGNVFENNVFVDNLNGFNIDNSESSTFRNNIFIGELESLGNVQYLVFENNLTSHPTDFNYVYYGSVSLNNIYDLAVNSLALNYSSGNSNQYFLQDFHLPPDSPAIGAGMNGTDCGIYGGDSPFKEGGVPSNPHIQAKNISNITDEEGNLPVMIKVSAQED
jgi:hypothetical protein